MNNTKEALTKQDPCFLTTGTKFREALFIGDYPEAKAAKINIKGEEWTVLRSEVLSVKEHDRALRDRFQVENNSLIEALKIDNNISKYAKENELNYNRVLRLAKIATDWGLI